MNATSVSLPSSYAGGPQGAPSLLSPREDAVSRQLSAHQEGPWPDEAGAWTRTPSLQNCARYISVPYEPLGLNRLRRRPTSPHGSQPGVSQEPLALRSLGRSHGSLCPVLVFATLSIPRQIAEAEAVLFDANSEYVFLHERESKPKLGASCRQAGAVW